MRGIEPSSAEVAEVAAALGWRMARRQTFASPTDAAAHAATLPKTEEGYVIRFASGLRLKAKGAAHCRLHALVARVTPLGLWDEMVAGDGLDAMRREIPEEFWSDFDDIRRLLESELQARGAAVAAVAQTVAYLSDKELGRRLKTLPDPARHYVFAYRQVPDLLADPRARAALLRDVEPKANALEGYRPSYALQRIAEDE